MGKPFAESRIFATREYPEFFWIAETCPDLHPDAMSELVRPAVQTTGSSPLKLVACGCLVLFVVGILGVGGLLFGIFKLMTNNDPYRDSIAAVGASPEAAAALGTPIKPGLLLSGNVSTNNGEGSVDLSIPVSGPGGKGTIRVIGTKSSGAPQWTYQTWELQLPDGSAIPLSK